jgi:hypothetical protein
MSTMRTRATIIALSVELSGIGFFEVVHVSMHEITAEGYPGEVYPDQSAYRQPEIKVVREFRNH